MRRLRLTYFAFASIALAPAALGAAQLGCNGNAGISHDANVIRAAEPIQGGTLDTTDDNVVAIIINTSQGMALCSGSLIAPNLVLSAHHCVADNTSTACGTNEFGALYSAKDFVITTSYDAAATVFNSASPKIPTPDGVTWFGVSSVAVPGQDICGQDLSALTLSSSVSGVCPLIPSVDTDVTAGETYTAVGFGITTPTGQTAGTRYVVTGMSVQCAETCNMSDQSSTEEWLGVNSGNKGTCEGDSGGPALDSLKRVVGSVSRGPENACNQTVYESYYGEGAWIKQMGAAAATAGGYAAAGWVTGGATSDSANGYCGGSSSTTTTGTTAATSTAATTTGSSGGTCAHAICTAGAALTASCDPCASEVCASDSYCCATKWDAQCVGEVASVCGESCSGSTSATTGTGTTGTTAATTGTGSSGGTTCGFTTGIMTCDACLTASCCTPETACANDATCVTCVTSSSPPASCDNDAAFVDFVNCFNNSCGTECGGSGTGGSTSSSTTGTGTTTGTSGTTTGTTTGASTTGTSGTTTGTGTGGAGSSGNGSTGTFATGTGTGTTTTGTGTTGGLTGTTGTGVTGTGSGNGGGSGSSLYGPGSSPSCSAAPAGGSAPASPLSFAGLLLGAAMVVSRRRAGR